MTFYRIAADVVQRKRHTTSPASRERKASGTSRGARTSTSTNILLFHIVFAIRATVDQRVRHLSEVMGAIECDRADRELRWHEESYRPAVPSASEIVSRRDRNYPSQSLVGNISAGWHAKTRADVRLPTDERTDGEGHGRYRSRDLVCTFPRTHRVVLPQVSAGPSWPARQSALFNVEILICWRGL